MRFLTILAFTALISMPAMAKTISVDVNGLVCDFCAQAVKKVIGEKDGVEDVTVDLNTKTVTIAMVEDKNLTDEEIEQLITDSGYDLVAINRE